ncbi:MAG: ferredoxin [Ilumatobacteraceae bacterium]
MKVWIDQDLCTGDGLCEEIAPDVFSCWTMVLPPA